MTYATQRDALVRTRQDLVIVGVRECQNRYSSLVQQLLTRTEQFDHADWVKTSVTVTADSLASPEGWSTDGATTADTIVMNADNDAISQTPAVAVTSKAFTGSVFLKVSGTSQLVTLRVRNVAGTQIGSKQVVVTSTWRRFFVHKLFTAVPVDNVVFEIIRLAGDATGSFYAWGANLWQNPADVEAVREFPYRKRVAEAVGTVSVNVSRCNISDQGDGARCFYSRITCQDPDNFNAGNVYEIYSPNEREFFYPKSAPSPTSLDWIIVGASTAWEAIDDVSGAPNDTDYVRTFSSAGAATLFKFADPSYLSGTPISVKFYVRAANSGAVNRDVSLLDPTLTFQYGGVAISVLAGTGFTDYSITATINDVTGLPWTYADILALASNGVVLFAAFEATGSQVSVGQFYWEPIGLTQILPYPKLRGLREFRFCRKDGPLILQGVADVAPMLTGISVAAQEIDAERAVTVNERVTFDFEDDSASQVWNIRQQSEGALVNTAKDVGTFWRRWLAIYRNYANPEGYVIRKIGYVEAGATENDYQTRGKYLIRNWEADDRKIMLTCSDRLRLTRKSIPSKIAADNLVTVSVTAAATTITVTDASAVTTPAVDASGTTPAYIVTLELEPDTTRAEKVNVTAVNLTTNVLTVTRGRWGTTARTHNNNVGFREVAEFGTEDSTPNLAPKGKNPIDIIIELYRRAGLAADEIDTATLQAERDRWIPSRVIPAYGPLFRRTVIDVTDVETLAKEIRELILLFMWVDESQLLTGKLFAPRTPADTYTTVTDDNNLVAGSISIDDNTDSRISRALIAYDLIPGESPDGAASFAKARIELDIDAEEREFYGESKLKVVLSQWLQGSDVQSAGYFTSHLISRFRHGARLFRARLEVKDDDIGLGEFIKVTTKHVQDVYGNDLDSIMQVVKKRQVSDNHIEIEALDTGIFLRFGFYAPAGAPVYSAATAAQREYGYFSDSLGFVGSPKVLGYHFW